MTKRIHKKIDRTPEEAARLQAVREQFQERKPSLADLVGSGEYNEPVTQGEYVFLRQLAAALKSAREGAGLSLADVEAKSGIDKAALSRLENGQQLNPTLNTLTRYASALGKRWTWALLDLDEKAAEDQGDEELTTLAESVAKALLSSPRMRHLLAKELTAAG